MKNAIRPKDRDAVLQSLRAGVVPRSGQHLVQVGRAREIQALMGDIDRVADGGSSFRLVVGEYGAGKTFFLNLVRTVAMEKKLVVANADLNPDRRLHSSGGQARSLYSELMRNMATRSRPEGGALAGVVEKFIALTTAEAESTGISTKSALTKRLEGITELVCGYDFANVIGAYFRAHESGNETLKRDAVRWLRGEFSTRTESNSALGVRSIVEDDTIYDHLKLMATFLRLAGYSGLMVTLDEMVNLYKLSNTQARNGNYEQLLRILNDSFQGSAAGLGFVLGGTPEFLTDTRRGVYSYQALQSRLAQNTFATEGRVDFTGPVIRLAALQPEDFYVLLQNIRAVYNAGLASPLNFPDQAIEVFMHHCDAKVGNHYYRTPRTTITTFINLLAVIEQNPDTTWDALIGSLDIKRDTQGQQEAAIDPADDDLASLKL